MGKPPNKVLKTHLICVQLVNKLKLTYLFILRSILGVAHKIFDEKSSSTTPFTPFQPLQKAGQQKFRHKFLHKFKYKGIFEINSHKKPNQDSFKQKLKINQFKTVYS